ncbi:hypothetical protein [Agromyces sp. SYSU T0242]|uniref:hypothetical protein n=1 Tax=Agromyces litoreus TaxID=3158561 RepID=UPI00339B62A5
MIDLSADPVLRHRHGEDGSMNLLMIIVGAVLAVAGTVWALQGVGILPGSVMSGVTMWAVIGPIVAIGGIALLWAGLARRRRAR